MARILVVDDRELLCRSVARVLSSQGHLADTVTDPEAALGLTGRNRYDVALVDFDLGIEPDGLKLLALIADAQPECARVLMTGGGDSRMWVDAFNRNIIHGALPKPFSEEQLSGAVEAARSRLSPMLPDIQARRRVREAERVFREAANHDQLQLAVQPIVGSVGPPFRPVAFECLLRSSHPLLPTAHQVLDTAERAGALFELGSIVARRAEEWLARLPSDALLFVNVDPKQLSDPSLIAQLDPLVPHAHRVVLEITERSTVQQIENWSGAVRALEHLGFQFAVDDLGAGYSGLWLLAELRPTIIKVDMSIVRDCHVTARKRRLIELIAGFADFTSARLVAEGVETAEEAATAVSAGAHLLQGFHFGRPSLEWNPG